MNLCKQLMGSMRVIYLERGVLVLCITEYSDGLKVAIKVLHLDLENTSKRFEVECNAMCNLRHRNLVKIISSYSNNLDFRSLVMEFMSNGSLDKWLFSDNYCLNFLQR
ncbi:Putative receptor-like protein kinase [Arachis hypogaea]|uniref:Receptor-like protein kinase n=1 Tax=Arachis hypogaea TaxID=3818 RepID=A0A6B9VAD3_ARAHY|nr:Putative receptor-like protein kinase [Arachis hypogaea]